MLPYILISYIVQKRMKIDFYQEEWNPNIWQEADHDPNP